MLATPETRHLPIIETERDADIVTREAERVLYETEHGEEIYATLKKEIAHPENYYRRSGIEIYQPASSSETKKKINLSTDPNDYPPKDRWYILEDPTLLEKDTFPPGYTVFENVVYGYPKSEKDIEARCGGCINYVVCDEKKYIQALYFGSLDAHNHFQNHLEGRSKTEKQKKRNAEVQKAVFEFLGADNGRHKKLREFCEKRGWHTDELRTHVAEFATANDFGKRQFVESVALHLERKGIDAQVNKNFVHEFETVKSDNLLEHLHEMARSHPAISRVFKDFSFELEDLLGLGYLDVKPAEFEAWRIKNGITEQELAGTGWYNVTYESKDKGARGKPHYSFTGRDVIRIPYYAFDEHGEPSIILWRTRHIHEKATKKHKYTHFPKDRSYKEERTPDELLYHIGFDIESLKENPPKRIVITEGEFKVAVTQMFLGHDTAVFGIPGITEVTPALLQTIKKIGASETIIVFDADSRDKRDQRTDDKTDSERAAYSIAKELMDAGVKNVKVGDLFGISQKKIGIDDALLEEENGPAKVENVLQNARPLYGDNGYATHILAKTAFNFTFEKLHDRRKRFRKLIKEAHSVERRGGAIDTHSLEKLVTYFKLVEAEHEKFGKFLYGSKSLDRPSRLYPQIFAGDIPHSERKVITDGQAQEYTVWTQTPDSQTVRLADPVIFINFRPADVNPAAHTSASRGEGEAILGITSEDVAHIKKGAFETTLKNPKKWEPRLQKLHAGLAMCKKNLDIPDFSLVRNELLEWSQKQTSSFDNLLSFLKTLQALSFRELYTALAAQQLKDQYNPKDYVYVPDLTLTEYEHAAKQGAPSRKVKIPLAILAAQKNNRHRIQAMINVIDVGNEPLHAALTRANQTFQVASDFFQGSSKHERKQYDAFIFDLVQTYLKAEEQSEKRSEFLAQHETPSHSRQNLLLEQEIEKLSQKLKSAEQSGNPKFVEYYTKRMAELKNQRQFFDNVEAKDEEDAPREKKIHHIQNIFQSLFGVIPHENVLKKHGIMYVTPDDIEQYGDVFSEKKMITQAMNAQLIKIQRGKTKPRFDEPMALLPIRTKTGRYTGLRMIPLFGTTLPLQTHTMETRDMQGLYGASREGKDHLYMEENLKDAARKHVYVTPDEVSAVPFLQTHEPTVGARNNFAFLPKHIQTLIESHPQKVTLVIPEEYTEQEKNSALAGAHTFQEAMNAYITEKTSAGKNVSLSTADIVIETLPIKP